MTIQVSSLGLFITTRRSDLLTTGKRIMMTHKKRILSYKYAVFKDMNKHKHLEIIIVTQLLKLIGYICSMLSWNNYITPLSPIIVNGSNIPSTLKIHAKNSLCSEITQSQTPASIRDSWREIRRYMLLKKFHYLFQFTIRIPPQHSIWPGCKPLKEVHTSIVGASFFLI